MMRGTQGAEGIGQDRGRDPTQTHGEGVIGVLVTNTVEIVQGVLGEGMMIIQVVGILG